jgi:hypothetical protein
MNRRVFVKKSVVACCAAPVLHISGILPTRIEKMPAWLLDLVKNNDSSVRRLSALQVKDVKSTDLGGVKDGFNILNPHSTAAVIQWGSCALSSPTSQFYQSTALLEEMHLAAAYLVKTQHADGTIDLLSTNFHSTPDTGFIVKRLVMAYVLIEKSKTNGQENLLKTLKTFLVRAGDALCAGGIHTPNHRWVVSAALAKLYTLWPEPRYAARAEQWLGEHIDLDQDGQFNEKSTYIYSALSDRLLITIAKGFNKNALLENVRRNLDMTMFYVHPNGEIVTDASGRQDKALVGTLENYYYPYRYLALLDNNGSYSAMCALIEKTAGPKIGSFLDYFLADPSLWNNLPPVKSLPVDYVKSFPKSGLVRIRRNTWDSTLIAENPVWLTFMKGNTVLQGVRFASSFFGKGQFQSDTIEKTEHGWELTQKLDGPYFQPYPVDKISPDGDWEKMPRSNRPQSEVQLLETKISIREKNNGIEIEIVTTGTERVPVAWEFIFRPGGVFSGPTQIENSKDSWLLSEGNGTYTFGENVISFGPGMALHKNIALRGSLPAMEAPSVYITGFTPFRHTVMIS